MKLPSQTTQAIAALVDAAITDETSPTPGLISLVFSNEGEEPYVYSAGKRGLASSEPLTPDHVLWIASCTKAITAICCMQLVEKGTLNLDDDEQLEGLCPELKDLPVLKKDGTTEPKRKGITLRMLLTHTAGFGYSFMNQRLFDYAGPVGVDELEVTFQDFMQPLLFQPGEGWEYGASMDWAGFAVERATGMKLGDYMHQHIFHYLGLRNIAMVPTEEMKKNLVYMHQRLPGGEPIPRNHSLRKALTVETEEEKTRMVHSGGGGLFSTPLDFHRILATLLNDGTCPRTGAQILAKATVDQMFENQIPDRPNFARFEDVPIRSARPENIGVARELYPVPGNPPQGWGLSWMISPNSMTGRSDKTVHWAGLANTYWWVDREKHVGGIISAQILPYGDVKVATKWVELEAAVYQGLAAS